MADIKKQVLGGMAWSFLDKMGSQGLSFIVGLILARLLMPVEYGIVALTSIFMAISTVLVDAGFGTALIQKKDADDLDYCTVMYSSIAIGVVAYAVLFRIAPFAADFYRTPGLKTVLRVVALPFIWSGYNSVLNAYLYKQMQFRKFFYRNLFANIASAVVGIWMAYNGLGGWALIAQSFTSNIIGMITLQCYVPWHPKLMYSFDRARSLIKYGANIAGASLIGTGFNELKGLLIGRLYTPTDLALFNKGGNFPKLIVNNIEGTIGAVLFPAMSQFGDDKEKVKQLARRSMRVGSYLMFFMMVTFVVTCEPLVRILYTEKWVGCVPYMQLVCLQLMIEMVSTENLQALKAVGDGGVILKLEIYKKPMFLTMTVIGACISVYALALTLPLYAVYSALVNMIPNKKVLGYSIKEQLSDLKPASLLSFVMFAIVYPINYLDMSDVLKVVCQVLVCILVYFGLSYLFKVESFRYTIKTIKQLKNK